LNELLFILTTQAGTYTLEYSPDGWNDALIEYERSDKYWGILRSFKMGMKFIKDGAGYLAAEFAAYGTAGVASIEIQKFNRSLTPPPAPVGSTGYYVAYSGDIDFGTFKRSESSAGITVEVNFIDGGLAKILKDNGSTEYEITNRIYGGSTFETFYLGVEVGSDTATGINVIDLAKRLLDKLTDNGYTAGMYGLTSTVLTALIGDPGVNNQPILVTNGSSIRNYNTTPTGYLKTTFEDFIKSIQWASTDGTGIGVGIETVSGVETLVIENRSYFFPTTVIADVGEVKTLTAYLETKLQWNRLKIGWPAKEYDNFYQEKEPNTEAKWKGPNAATTTELDLVNKYRADDYGIQEIITSGSDSSDDDIFFIECTRDNNYPRWDHLQPSKARFADYPITEWYIGNALLTPLKCLTAVQKWLECCMYNHSGDKIKYTRGDNNYYQMEVATWSEISGLGSWVRESDDITIALPTIFHPITIEIEAAMTLDFLQQLSLNTTGLIKFAYNGHDFYGYIMAAKVTLYGRSSQKITLLSAASNNLSQLLT